MLAKSGDQYVLGHSGHEMDRLALQAAIIGPITERLLRAAGLAEGMRVLDLGCGVGDVSMLAAGIVGPSGTVVGIDKSAEAVARAWERSSALDFRNIRFQEGDLTALDRQPSFDAVIGRYILIHMADPAGTLRLAADLVKPGGLVAFHEIDLKNPPRSNPPVPAWDQTGDWLYAAFGRALAHPDAALRLTEHFERAGLPTPTLFCETPLANGASRLVCRWFADTALILKPQMLDMGLTEAAMLDEHLAGQLQEAARMLSAQLMGPAQICAWARIA